MMADAQTFETTRGRSLRLWPAAVILLLQWVAKFTVPVIAPDIGPFAVMAGVIGGLAIIVWWLFFSRALWSDRLSSVPQ